MDDDGARTVGGKGCVKSDFFSLLDGPRMEGVYALVAAHAAGLDALHRELAGADAASDGRRGGATTMWLPEQEAALTKGAVGRLYDSLETEVLLKRAKDARPMTRVEVTKMMGCRAKVGLRGVEKFCHRGCILCGTRIGLLRQQQSTFREKWAARGLATTRPQTQRANASAGQNTRPAKHANALLNSSRLIFWTTTSSSGSTTSRPWRGSGTSRRRGSSGAAALLSGV